MNQPKLCSACVTDLYDHLHAHKKENCVSVYCEHTKTLAVVAVEHRQIVFTHMIGPLTPTEAAARVKMAAIDLAEDAKRMQSDAPVH